MVDMYKQELSEMKNKINSVMFKKSFYKGWYVLSAIGKDGYILIGKYGLAKYDIWVDDIEDAIKWLKDNRFKIHKDSIIR